MNEMFDINSIVTAHCGFVNQPGGCAMRQCVPATARTTTGGRRGSAAGAQHWPRRTCIRLPWQPPRADCTANACACPRRQRSRRSTVRLRPAQNAPPQLGVRAQSPALAAWSQGLSSDCKRTARNLRNWRTYADDRRAAAPAPAVIWARAPSGIARSMSLPWAMSGRQARDRAMAGSTGRQRRHSGDQHVGTPHVAASGSDCVSDMQKLSCFLPLAQIALYEIPYRLRRTDVIFDCLQELLCGYVQSSIRI